MQKELVILIAERNPHIRNLVQRELMNEGYYVFTVENVLQLKNYICMRREPDVLVLDPDLPGSEASTVQGLLANFPRVPIIIHGFGADEWKEGSRLKPYALVEKTADSISILKNQIRCLCEKDLALS